MTKLQRAQRLILGIAMLVFAAALAWLAFWDKEQPDLAYSIVLIVLCVMMLLFGVRMILYYVFMARHMVGGLVILLYGVLFIDFGLFAIALADIPRIYILVYLFASHLFYSVIDILRAFEQRKHGAKQWRLKLAFGIANIAIALFALVGGLLMRAFWVPVAVYCVGLVYSAIERISDAFRKTDIVFIEN